MKLRIQDQNLGIWKFNEYFVKPIDFKHQLTINEGATPLINLDFAYPVQLKLELNNPTGSHKDRGLAYQLSYYHLLKEKEFVISSSGNSAISTIAFANKYNLKVHLFLSEKISATKIARLKSYITLNKNFSFNYSHRPVSDSFKFAKEHSLTLLRGSTDIIAPEGYKSIAFELYTADKTITDIFIPCSSGTTVSGIYKGLLQIKEIDNSYTLPRIHVVQSESINPISSHFDKDFTPIKKSITDSIVDRVAHRKYEIINIINSTNGFGWIVKDSSIKEMQLYLKKNNINSSYEGAMTLSALQKAKLKGLKITNPVCIITGVV